MGNKLNIELASRYIILQSGGRQGYKGNDIERVFYCESGFGCSSATSGNAIYGKFVFDGEECRIEGYEIERLATDKEVNQANILYKNHVGEQNG